ncbi:hypothetical protein [Micromonospora sp. NPDC048898]|uniref:hypothetical protein n=1 Tax=Micromonospora sp. NPDC048898 TaxID=3364260 RepID=UPI0037163C18
MPAGRTAGGRRAATAGTTPQVCPSPGRDWRAWLQADHAGHADILREQHDGAIGWRRDNSNIPDGYDWPAYVRKLTKLADRFG